MTKEKMFTDIDILDAPKHWPKSAQSLFSEIHKLRSPLLAHIACNQLFSEIPK